MLRSHTAVHMPHSHVRFPSPPLRNVPPEMPASPDASRNLSSVSHLNPDGMSRSDRSPSYTLSSPQTRSAHTATHPRIHSWSHLGLPSDAPHPMLRLYNSPQISDPSRCNRIRDLPSQFPFSASVSPPFPSSGTSECLLPPRPLPVCKSVCANYNTSGHKIQECTLFFALK